jgi:hypothetical protein
MDQHCLSDAMIISKYIDGLLHEVLDLSGQLMQALDRDDQVSVQMLLQMRAEPVSKLKVEDQALRDLCRKAPTLEDQKHLASLLKGDSPSGEQEKALVNLSAANARQLKKVLELDQRLNRRVTRGKSVYH